MAGALAAGAGAAAAEVAAFDGAGTATAGFEDATGDSIEARMRQLAEENIPVSRRVLPRDEAVKVFRDQGEIYKAEIIELSGPGTLRR